MALKQEDVKAAIASGKNHKLKDGRSLYLYVKNGHGFWVHQFTDFGPTKNNPTPHPHTRSTCLGPAWDMTPAQARKARDKFAVDRREGRDVGLASKRVTGELFSTAAAAYLDNHADEWNARHRAGLKALAQRYIPADFNALRVTAITHEHVADVLRPIWNGPGNNRGSRLRRLIKGVLDAKNVHPNPARWDGGPLPELLSKKRVKVKHRDAMPYADVPAFFASLSDSVEDRAGRFVILTAVRRNEALGAKWGEFDFAKREWNVAVERMKMRRPHKVPLTDAMIEALGTPGDRDAYVFPSRRTGRMLGHKALDKEWLPEPYTLHGFRTSFSTWAEEQDDGRAFAPAVIKAATSHGKENAVEAAYRRSDLFEARRKLMQSWSAFTTGRARCG